MKRLSIKLAWPSKYLWPNGSEGSRWGRARAKKVARSAADWATRAAKGRNSFDCETRPLPVEIEVHAKPKGPLPDEQNVVIAHKAAIDGIADALGINDRDFAAPTVKFSGRDPLGAGSIIIHLGDAE